MRRGGGGSGGGGGGGSNVVDCNSDGGRYRECSIGSGYFGRLLRDNSNGRCRQNSTWGTRNGVIWVTEGCRGRFERVRGNSGGSGGSNSSTAAQAERACVQEVQRRGGRVLQQWPAVPHDRGYKMELQVRAQSGEQRRITCKYDRHQQVRLDPL